MLQVISDHVKDRWYDWFPGQPRPSRFCFLKVSTSIAPQGKIVLLVFGDNQREPQLVVKWTRHPELSWLIRHEHEILQEIYPRLSPRMQASVSGPLDLFRHGRSVVLMTRALPGKRLSLAIFEAMRLGNFSKVLGYMREVAAWATMLHRETRQSVSIEGAVESWLKMFIDYYQPPDRVQAELIRAAAKVSSVERVVAHGDLSPGNILVSRKGVRVIDWGMSDTRGVPVIDVYHLLLSVAYYLSARPYQKRNYEKAFDYMFLHPGAARNMAVAVLHRYMGELKLDTSTLFEWFLLALAYEATVGLKWFGAAGENDQIFASLLDQALDREPVLRETFGRRTSQG